MRSAQEIRSHIRYTIAMVVLAGLVLWGAYVALDALKMIYIAAVFATGFGPIVRVIERQKLLPIGSRRFPRWLAILILYLAILGTVGLALFLILPPLIDQAQALWNHGPQMFDKAQLFLISKGWLKERLTIGEAVERAPGAGGDAVT